MSSPFSLCHGAGPTEEYYYYYSLYFFFPTSSKRKRVTRRRYLSRKYIFFLVSEFRTLRTVAYIYIYIRVRFAYVRAQNRKSDCRPRIRSAALRSIPFAQHQRAVFRGRYLLFSLPGFFTFLFFTLGQNLLIAFSSPRTQYAQLAK